MSAYRLIVGRVWTDGYAETIVNDEETGDAKACHERLAKRWKDAGHTFERDAKALTLTKQHADGELVYTEIVQHVAVEG